MRELPTQGTPSGHEINRRVRQIERHHEGGSRRVGGEAQGDVGGGEGFWGTFPGIIVRIIGTVIVWVVLGFIAYALYIYTPFFHYLGVFFDAVCDPVC